MNGSAWADFLDARLRLVHEWAGDGLTFDEMVERLTPDADQLALVLLTPTIPPLPGCVRDRAHALQQRVAELERELHAKPEPPAPPGEPRVTQVRALMSDPDPEQCGCQYWTDRPPNHQHHRECSYAPPPPSPSKKP